MKKLLVLMLGSLVLASAANALTTQEIRDTQAACLAKAVSTADMKMCVYAAYQSGDALLNATYKNYVSRLENAGTVEAQETLKRLVKAEVAWIKYKEANCDFSGVTMLGGTGEGLTISSCLTEETLKRTDELNQILGWR